MKLALTDETEPLCEMLKGSRVEFSRHVDVEKEIKSWLVNGAQWLIALRAFETNGRRLDLKLNEYLAAKPVNREFAWSVMNEMRAGVALLLRQDPKYAAFVRDTDVDAYLHRAARTVYDRFAATPDPITRILARWRTPTPEEHQTIEAFNRRFADRIDPPIIAYEAKNGVPPPAVSQSLFSLHRLVAFGGFIDKPVQQPAEASVGGAK